MVLSARAVSSHPGEFGRLWADSSRPMLASPHPAGWPLPYKCNEAEPSSQDATARAFTFPGLNARDCSPALRSRLHDFRPIIMINTFQLTRTTKLCLALSGFHGCSRMSKELNRDSAPEWPTRIDANNENGIWVAFPMPPRVSFPIGDVLCEKCGPKPATILVPQKGCSLRELWSRKEKHGYVCFRIWRSS